MTEMVAHSHNTAAALIFTIKIGHSSTQRSQV